MKEEINKRIAEYDDEINKLQYEIEKVKFEKRRFLVDNEGVLLGEKISRYEKKHFITYWNIESLVLKGESYEEWFKRVGSRCYGYTGKKANKKLWEEKCRVFYLKGGIYTEGNYIKWLIQAKDERLKPYKIYEKCI